MSEQISSLCQTTVEMSIDKTQSFMLLSSSYEKMRRGCFRISESVLQVHVRAKLLSEEPSMDGVDWGKSHFFAIEKRQGKKQLIADVAEYIAEVIKEARYHSRTKQDERVLTWMMVWNKLRNNSFPLFGRDIALMISDMVYRTSSNISEEENARVVDVVVWHATDLVFAEQIAKDAIEEEEWEKMSISSMYSKCEVLFMTSLEDELGVCVRPGYEKKKIGRRFKREIMVKADKDVKLRRALGSFE